MVEKEGRRLPCVRRGSKMARMVASDRQVQKQKRCVVLLERVQGIFSGSTSKGMDCFGCHLRRPCSSEIGEQLSRWKRERK